MIPVMIPIMRSRTAAVMGHETEKVALRDEDSE